MTITLGQATKYWEDTRKGAHHNLAAFRRLDAGLRGSDLRCKVPAGAASGGAHQRLVDCREATTQFADSMNRAWIAVATWVHHIHDMNALRAGLITPEQATTMWTQSWHKGERQLKRYDRQATEALHQDCG